jgi:hypothetical protein
MNRRRALRAAPIALLILALVIGGLTAPALGDNRTVPPTLAGGQNPPESAVHYLDGQSKETVGPTATSVFDVDKLDNGSLFVTFADKSVNQSCGRFPEPCSHTGYRIIDENGSVEAEWTMRVRDGFNSEVHDADMLSDGSIVVAEMEYESIFILEDGERVWTWNASERYDKPADPTNTDWLHINDVDHLGDGRFLVSVRNANEILIVERGEGVTEVINEGGNESIIKAQHNPQWLGNETVLVADSENHRIVELQKTDGEWRPTWVVREAGGVSFDWPRDADRLPNGNTLITDSQTGRVLEVDEHGTMVWERELPGKPYEATRIGVGESVGAPVHGNGVEINHRRKSIPILSGILHRARFVAPLPYWVNELHLLLFIGSVYGAVDGAAALIGSQIQRRRQAQVEADGEAEPS